MLRLLRLLRIIILSELIFCIFGSFSEKFIDVYQHSFSGLTCGFSRTAEIDVSRTALSARTFPSVSAATEAYPRISYNISQRTNTSL